MSNLDAAAAAEAKRGFGKKRTTGTKDGEGSSQVLVRTSPESHERWKQAAAAQGISMAEFVRTAADAAAAEVLDCDHGAQHRRWYPWAETCLKCGMQLREKDQWLVDPHLIPHVRPLNANPALL